MDNLGGLFAVPTMVFIFNIALISLGIAALVLFIKVCKKAIIALDIYIENNHRNEQ